MSEGKRPAADPLAALIALRELPRRRIAGLMSGTSADGIDVAIIDVAGHGQESRVDLLHYESVPLPIELKRRIWALPDGRSANICELNFLIGRAFAEATLGATRRAGMSLEDLHLVGSHGQTARHQPPGFTGGCPSTLQIGEGAVIAEATGLPVVCDFRVADVAAGGQGAPLIPLVDYLLFRHAVETRILLNLGGIANITVVTPELDGVFAFDTGPANMPLDAVARMASKGRQTFDQDGLLAEAGEVDSELLSELLGHPYFQVVPPKSTGRAMFGRDFTYPLLDRYAERLPTLMATLVAVVVESVARGVETFALADHEVSALWVSGGGVHNPALMSRLERRLAPLEVKRLQGAVDPDAKEAVGFALLANETLFGSAGNVPRATGAAGGRVLGKIALSS